MEWLLQKQNESLDMMIRTRSLILESWNIVSKEWEVEKVWTHWHWEPGTKTLVTKLPLRSPLHSNRRLWWRDRLSCLKNRFVLFVITEIPQPYIHFHTTVWWGYRITYRFSIKHYFPHKISHFFWKNKVKEMRKLFISPIENQPISIELLWFWSQSLHTSTLQPLYQKRSFNLGPRL